MGRSGGRGRRGEGGDAGSSGTGPPCPRRPLINLDRPPGSPHSHFPPARRSGREPGSSQPGARKCGAETIREGHRLNTGLRGRALLPRAAQLRAAGKWAQGAPTHGSGAGSTWRGGPSKICTHSPKLRYATHTLLTCHPNPLSMHAPRVHIPERPCKLDYTLS